MKKYRSARTVTNTVISLKFSLSLHVFDSLCYTNIRYINLEAEDKKYLLLPETVLIGCDGGGGGAEV